MARVFMPPHYKGQDQRYIKLRDAEFTENAELAALGYDIIEDMHSIEGLEDEAEAYSIGNRKKLDYVVTLTAAIRAIVPANVTVISDFRAVYTLWHALVTGKIVPCDDRTPISCMGLARDLALMGSVAGSVTPSHAKAWLDKADPLACLNDNIKSGYRLLSVPDTLRMGIHRGKALAHFRKSASNKDDLDIDKLEVTEGSFRSAMCADKVFILPVGIIFHNVCGWFLLSVATLNYLADVVWSSCMWLICASVDPAVGSLRAAEEGLRYVVKAVGDNLKHINSVEKIARHMKCAYAEVIARLGSGEMGAGEARLLADQLPALRAEAESVRTPSENWADVVMRWPEGVQANYGTAWNLLPPPDADPRVVNAAIKEKYNASRQIDHAAWDDFIAYATSAISAAYLVVHPDAEVVWDNRDSDPDWAMSCRQGHLTYPDKGDRCRIVRALPWKKTLETWHLAAEDVTHVDCNIANFTSKSCGVRSELAYVLDHGSTFSNGCTPARVRTEWEAGTVPGDRVLYAAAKSENTKFGAKTRETMSGDDIMRACLSEIDENMSLVGKFVHGVSSRAGRPGVESMVANVLNQAHGNKNGVVVSLDVSGWSPNMIREKELAFIDSLMRFFDIPDAQKASTVFRDTNVVTARMGFFDKWVAKDGSIQGFFGTADTILHSLIAQWCLSRLKDEGYVAKNVKMSKATLIDDIIMSFSGILKTEGEVVRKLKRLYAQLGFDADIVKTLASRHKAVFLNRVYTHGREELTYAKIAARADREWERRWVTFHDEIDSIFGSMSGAVDRGMMSLAGYFLCCWRIAWRAYRLSAQVATHAPLTAVYGAWLPRSLGGWGMPTLTGWCARETQHALDSGLSALSVIHGQLSRIKNPYAHLAASMMIGLETAELAPRSVLAFISDPLAVTAACAHNVKDGITNACRTALKTRAKDAEIRALLMSSDHTDYADTIRSAASVHVYPSEALSEWADSLPHTVCASLITKFVDSGMASRYLKFSTLARIKNEFSRRNRKSVSAFSNVEYTDRTDLNVKGSELAMLLRKRMFDDIGMRVSTYTKPTVGDIIGSCEANDDPIISAYVPAVDVPSRISSDNTLKIIRSRGTPAALDLKVSSPKDSSVLAKAYIKCARITAVLRAGGYSVAALRDAWSRTWFGHNTEVAFHDATGSIANYARVASRTNSRTFTSACAPNVAPDIVIDASRLLNMITGIHSTIPHMSWVVYVRTMCAIDVENGFGSGLAHRRGFSVRVTPASVRDDYVDKPAAYAPSSNLAGVVDPRVAQVILPTIVWEEWQDITETLFSGERPSIVAEPERALTLAEKLSIGSGGEVFDSFKIGAGYDTRSRTSNADVRTAGIAPHPAARDLETKAFLTILEGVPTAEGSEALRAYADEVADRSQHSYPVEIRGNKPIWDMLLCRDISRFKVGIRSLSRALRETPSFGSIRALRLASASKHNLAVNNDALSFADRSYHRAMYLALSNMAHVAVCDSTHELLAMVSGLYSTVDWVISRGTNEAAAAHVSVFLQQLNVRRIADIIKGVVDTFITNQHADYVRVRTAICSAGKTCMRFIWTDTVIPELRTTAVTVKRVEARVDDFDAMLFAPPAVAKIGDVEPVGTSIAWRKTARENDAFARFKAFFASCADIISSDTIPVTHNEIEDNLAAQGIWANFLRENVTNVDV